MAAHATKRPALLAALLFAMALAGCLGGGDDGGDEPEANGEAPPPTNANETSAAKGARPASDNATYLENQDYSREHIHDYWSGAETRILMDEIVDVDPFEDGFSFQWDEQGPRTGFSGYDFTLPNATFVPEGTGELVVEVDATAALKNGQITLAYLANNQAEHTELEPQGAQASWTIEVRPEMADVPHAKKTVWDFELRSADATTVMDGDIHILITAKRLLDIQAWPEHPDFWESGTLTRMDLGNQSGTYDYLTQHIIGAEDEQQYERIPVQGLVPPETRALVVTLTYQRNDDPKNEINGPVLLVVKDGATSRGHRVMHGNAYLREPGVIAYAVPVDETAWDSPYAEASGWSFRLHAPFGLHDFPDNGDEIDIGILDSGAGSYDVGIKAFRVVPPWLEEVLKDEICRSC